MILLFCGLSGAGKTTLARSVAAELTSLGIKIEIIDGDEYRAALCRDLGFSKEDRNENIRRLEVYRHVFVWLVAEHEDILSIAILGSESLKIMRRPADEYDCGIRGEACRGFHQRIYTLPQV